MTVAPLGLGLPAGREWTVADLESLPDDGLRYELLDGALLMSPAPGFSHQTALLELAVVLRGACPAGLRVVAAPFGVQLDERTELQPDLLVAPLHAFTSKNLPVAPLLVVEVRSPTTRLIDETVKRAAYARHGVPSYWLVNPDPDRPSVTVLSLVDGDYVEAARAVHAEELAVTDPFPVRFRPADLVVRLPAD